MREAHRDLVLDLGLHGWGEGKGCQRVRIEDAPGHGHLRQKTQESLHRGPHRLALQAQAHDLNGLQRLLDTQGRNPAAVISAMAPMQAVLLNNFIEMFLHLTRRKSNGKNHAIHRKP
jgi:hypothetical protein